MSYLQRECVSLLICHQARALALNLLYRIEIYVFERSRQTAGGMGREYWDRVSTVCI